jgi:hypothetical protein
MSPTLVFVIQGPQQQPQVRELALPRIVIGRETGDLVIADPLCSSMHAEVTWDGQRVVFRDLGSTNGSYVGGQRVSAFEWSPGTSLQIGQHSILLREVRQANALRGRTVVAQAVPMQMPYQAPQAAPAPAPAMPGAPAMAQGAYGAPGPSYGQHGMGPAPHAQQASAPGQHHPGYAPVPGGVGYGAPAYGMPPARPRKKSGGLVLLIAIPLVLLVMCGGGIAALVVMSDGSDGDDRSPSLGSVTTRPSTGALLTEPREASVDFVWYAGEPGPTAKGGTAPARIRVSPNRTGSVSVGVSEEFAGGGGNQWRTATWLAAFNAARVMQGSLADYEFSVHVGGHTDGPSAGMLTTTAMVALLRNAKLRTDSTMTGTVNPDGTAGPVGGIVQKMEGAKEKGLKRFGFPVGCRNHRDMKTGSDVDLVATGSQLGLEAREIGDIYEAYEFMTGERIERAEPVADGDLEPLPATQSLLRAKIGGWKGRVDREIGELRDEAKRSGSAVQAAAPLLAEAEKFYERAQRNERNGFLAPALQDYAATAISVAAARRFTMAVTLLMKQDLDGLLSMVQTAKSIEAEVESFGRELEVKAQNKTRGGQVTTTAAYTNYVVARSATMIGDDFLGAALQMVNGIKSGQLKPTEDTVGTMLVRIILPTLYYDLARVFLDYARDMQSLITDEGGAQPLPTPALDRTVAGYASASSAVYAYFDALIVEEVAKANRLSADEARAMFAEREYDYYIGRKANLLSEYGGKSGVTDGVKLMRLAAASSAYLIGAKLVNKWYSLGGSFDKDGALVLDNRRALSAQLELARRTAREAAGRAKKEAGFIPTPARLAFQVASAAREGTDEEKLSALAAYWESTFWSELSAAR